MEEAAPKSPPPESAISVEIALNFPELVDELIPEIPIKEELIDEVMQQLYKEITTTNAAADSTGTGTSDCTKPSSPAATFPTPSLVVGNGKSESCGASVSDSASTVMAGVEFVGPAGKTGGSPEGGAWRSDDGLVVGKGGMDGWDHAGEVDDEWLERVLMSTWGPEDLDPWL